MKNNQAGKIKIGFMGWLVIIIIILIAFMIWWKPHSDAKRIEKEVTLTSREVALQCTTDMATKYHIHPALQIYINGEKQEIPEGVGVSAICMNSLHTHDATGTIHVEAPVQKDFTLGDFFAVWKKDFSKDKILDSVVTPDTEIVVTVNDKVVDTYENTVLHDLDKIVISYLKK